MQGWINGAFLVSGNQIDNENLMSLFEPICNVFEKWSTLIDYLALMVLFRDD